MNIKWNTGNIESILQWVETSGDIVIEWMHFICRWI